MTARTTVVLVHGGFTDASGWWPMVLRLLGDGHPVRAPAISGRSFAGDCAYVLAFVERLDGPVLLVGHGYGAAVVSVAGSAGNVAGVLFIAGYALAGGESIAELSDGFAPAEVASHLVLAPYLDADGVTGTEISVEIDRFPLLLGEGLPADETSVLAVSQRPVSAAVFTERAPGGPPRSAPSWGVVATRDRAVPPGLQHFGYRRAGCREIASLDGPHLVIQTHAAELVRFVDGILEEIAR